MDNRPGRLSLADLKRPAERLRFWAAMRKDAAERIMAAPDRWQEHVGLWSHAMYCSNACALELGLVKAPCGNVIDFYDPQTIMQELEQDIAKIESLLSKLESLEKRLGD